MAEAVMSYHNNIQDKDAPDFTFEKQEAAMRDVLRDVKADMDWQDKQLLSANVTRDEVRDALKKAQSGKAAGIDGIPYEFWAAFMGGADDETQTNDDGFDSIKYLTLVFNDIEAHGTLPDTKFADGWLCPIYKKGDKRKIENYRPITLLNSDYKIYTRTLTSKLGTVADTLIHEDQAGFVPKRHIENQTQTCRVLVDYAEALEEDGVIVALDQEKAYDKIDHTYLWRTLEALGLPPRFIKKMGPGGISQYLAVVQGMPSHVESELIKMIRTFMWDSSSSPPVGMDTLYRPISEGGLGLLDLKARNEAINMMWLKRYLTLTPNRPKWAYAMDAILAKHVVKRFGAIDTKAQVNTFLQSWTPAYAARSRLPRYIKDMLSTGKSYCQPGTT
ncbi:hypothetical protein EVJ58_g8730 [Rhodofomes roseus]|uniref:Reverse transcriptase domain-containing protein n=1 Tax=Rhodofomes roseus TaxID=34475 RepID=A0A4Y9XZ75_9APHY|nr:hypothetical protein EVJ58_g8730 [Rhodofomes roseus]